MFCNIRNSSTPLIFPYISGREGLAPSWTPDLGNPDLPELDFYSSHCSGFFKHEIVYLEDIESLRIPGVQVGVVSEIGVTIPKTAKIPQTLESCRLWEPKNLLDEKYVDGTPLWHAFMGTLVCGMTVEDSSTAHSRETLDLEALLDGYLRCVKLGMTDQYTDKICRWLECSLPGRSLSTMTDARFGLCLLSVQVGDYVCVGLGCKRALTLHPLARKHNSFQLRGECYLHGFNQSEALLGSLAGIPSTRNPWTARWRWSFDGGYTNDDVVYTDCLVETQNDPRLGPLPAGWRMRFGFPGNQQDEEYDAEGVMQELWFHKVGERSVTTADPRLTSEALIARGVNVQDFVIV